MFQNTVRAEGLLFCLTVLPEETLIPLLVIRLRGLPGNVTKTICATNLYRAKAQN